MRLDTKQPAKARFPDNPQLQAVADDLYGRLAALEAAGTVTGPAGTAGAAGATGPAGPGQTVHHMLVMWSNPTGYVEARASVPSGWLYCDGTNGTPDMVWDENGGTGGTGYNIWIMKA